MNISKINAFLSGSFIFMINRIVQLYELNSIWSILAFFSAMIFVVGGLDFFREVKKEESFSPSPFHIPINAKGWSILGDVFIRMLLCFSGIVITSILLPTS